MAKKTEHPLADYTATTPVAAQPNCVCQVRSLLPPVHEDGKRKDSLGRLKVKGGDPEVAAKHYRETKHLPDDWPVVVQVLELTNGAYKEVRKVKCPTH